MRLRQSLSHSLKGLAVAAQSFLVSLGVFGIAAAPILAQPRSAAAQSSPGGGTYQNAQASQTGWGLNSLTLSCSAYSEGYTKVELLGEMVENGAPTPIDETFVTNWGMFPWEQAYDEDWSTEMADQWLSANDAAMTSDELPPYAGSLLYSHTVDVFSLALLGPGSTNDPVTGALQGCFESIFNQSNLVANADDGSGPQGRWAKGREWLDGKLEWLKRMLQKRWVRWILKGLQILDLVTSCLAALLGEGSIARCIYDLIWAILTKNPWGALLALLIDMLELLLNLIGLDPFCAICRQIPGSETLCRDCYPDPEPCAEVASLSNQLLQRGDISDAAAARVWMNVEQVCGYQGVDKLR